MKNKLQYFLKKVDRLAYKFLKWTELLLYKSIERNKQKEKIKDIETLKKTLEEYYKVTDLILKIVEDKNFNKNKLITYYLEKELTEIVKDTTELKELENFIDNLMNCDNLFKIRILLLNRAEYLNIKTGGCGFVPQYKKG